VDRDPDFAHCVAIRTQVFVEGQGVSAEEEWDGLDPECVHFLARRGGSPVGTARLRRAGADAKAERVAVLESQQGTGVGRAVMLALESEARRIGLGRVLLHAQVRVIPFYERLGYEAYGPEFVEADILHRKMRKPLDGAYPRR
jgi:ElaA protein